MAGGSVEEDMINVNTFKEKFDNVKTVIEFVITLITKFKEKKKGDVAFIELTNGDDPVPTYTADC